MLSVAGSRVRTIREGVAMMSFRVKRMATLGLAVAVLFGGTVFVAGSSQAAVKKATVSVFHAIPEGMGVDVVDVFADGTRVINNLKPGELKSLRLRPGKYDIGIYVNGQRPTKDEPVLAIDDVRLLSGTCSTITANLDEAGNPATNVFANCVSRNPVGEGRLTVRHVAAAPEVDVLVGGSVAFGSLSNGASATKQLPATTYALTVALADTDTRVLGPLNVTLTRPLNMIVYVWGSAEDGTLAFKVQRVPINR